MRYPLWVIHEYFTRFPGHDRELAWYEGIDHLKPTPGYNTELTAKIMKFKPWLGPVRL